MGVFSKKQRPADAAPAVELGHVKSAPADPERPAVGGAGTATSAPAGALDSLAQQQQQPHKDQGLVGRSKSDPTGTKPASQRPQKDTLTPEQERTLQHVRALVHVMDQSVNIPVLNRKIGLDALIGLVPYAGDMAGASVGTYIITRALKFNMPKRLVLRMLANQAIDSVCGIVPFVGDIFDIGFKANVRNMKLLEEHLEHPKQAKRADTCFLLGLFFLVVVLPMVLFFGIILAIILIVLAVFGKLG